MKTTAQELIEKFGVENIFMTKRDYHGLYEDDDCEFEYYNNVTGEFSGDSWTTRFACPSFSNFECTTITEGIKKGLVDTEKLLGILRKRFHRECATRQHMSEVACNGLRVEVKRGRKWKGFGYYVGKETGKLNLGYKTMDIPFYKIYDPMTGRIETINANNCDFVDEQALRDKYTALWNETLENNTDADSIAYVPCDGVMLRLEIMSFKEFVEKWTKPVDTSDAFDEVEYERKKKACERRAKKMKDIVNWVWDNTDKECYDVYDLASHIYNKHNQ